MRGETVIRLKELGFSTAVKFAQNYHFCDPRASIDDSFKNSARLFAVISCPHAPILL